MALWILMDHYGILYDIMGMFYYQELSRKFPSLGRQVNLNFNQIEEWPMGRRKSIEGLVNDSKCRLSIKYHQVFLVLIV